MKDHEPDDPADPSSDPPRGLCGSCRHARAITSARGSIFLLCQLSAIDPSFPRYPALPVMRCRGYEPIDRASAGSGSRLGLP